MHGDIYVVCGQLWELDISALLASNRTETVLEGVKVSCSLQFPSTCIFSLYIHQKLDCQNLHYIYWDGKCPALLANTLPIQMNVVSGVVSKDTFLPYKGSVHCTVLIPRTILFPSLPFPGTSPKNGRSYLLLQQLTSGELNLSVKLYQLRRTKISWWTEQLSVGITRMTKPASGGCLKAALF